MLKEIGERIRLVRLSRHMSQAQLAAMLDVSVPYISHIEQGKQAMSIVTLQAICNALEISADWVLRNNSPVSKQMVDEDIAQLLADCTMAERSALLDVMASVKKALRIVAPPEE